MPMKLALLLLNFPISFIHKAREYQTSWHLIQTPPEQTKKPRTREMK